MIQVTEARLERTALASKKITFPFIKISHCNSGKTVFFPFCSMLNRCVQSFLCFKVACFSNGLCRIFPQQLVEKETTETL